METIKPLNTEVYNKGTCFICLQPCIGYVHFQCSVAYCEHKQKLIRELQIKKESRQDKEFNNKLNKILK